MIITVIIPVYKNINFLKSSLKSLEHQSFKNFEVIIVNDGSREVKKIKTIVKNFKNLLNLRLINRKLNRGVSYALNIGIKEANGDYISWLSSDDYFHPEKLKTQVKLIKNKDICLTGFYCVNNKNKIFKNVKYNRLFFSPSDHILIRDNFNFCTMLIKKKILIKAGLFDESLRHVQDYDMMFKLFKKYKPVILNKCLFYSRHHHGQSSVQHRKKAFYEKEKFYSSKFNVIKSLYKKSNILKKVIIIFFLRLKNLEKLNLNIKILINNEIFFVKIIMKMIYFLSEIYLISKKKFI